MKTTLNTSMQISTRRLNRLELIWGFHRYSLWCKNTEFVVKIRFKEKRPNNIYAWVRASILPQKICPKKPCKKANYSPVVERLAHLWLLNPSSRCASWAPSWEFKSPGEQQEQRAQDAQLCAEEGAWNQVWLSNLRGGARHHQAAQNEVWTGLIPAFKVRAHGADGDFNCFSEAGLLLMKFFSHSKMILEELIKTLVVGFISALQV